MMLRRVFFMACVIVMLLSSSFVYAFHGAIQLRFSCPSGPYDAGCAFSSDGVMIGNTGYWENVDGARVSTIVPLFTYAQLLPYLKDEGFDGLILINNRTFLSLYDSGALNPPPPPPLSIFPLSSDIAFLRSDLLLWGVALIAIFLIVRFFLYVLGNIRST